MPGSRPLTPAEHAVLDRLLSAEFDGVAELRAQAATVRVTGGCDCGCPTIHFREGNNGLRLVAEAANPAQDQTVLLFVGEDGHLESMELAWVTDAPPSTFPKPDDLAVQPR